jgi:hypothetical protein
VDYVIRINTDNAAFAEGFEQQEILRSITHAFEANWLPGPGESLTLYDYNGNSVGSIRVEESR